ncbi:MAG: hypothetical protein H7839_24035 [Magnetococcus sp. YQC-5]
MRLLLTTLALFIVLSITGAGVVFYMLAEPGPEGRMAYLLSGLRLMMYDHGLLEKQLLTDAEKKRLYQATCTRKCHSADLVEKTPRTAMEWERIVHKMRTTDRNGQRAGFSPREGMVIVEWLQKNHLGTLPTLLPEQTMRFLKKHLWRMDFGESDLYLDVIHIPQSARFLVPNLVLSQEIPTGEEVLFVVYVNTHTGVVPPWNLAKMTRLTDAKGSEYLAKTWQQIYEDGQLHHRQGILSFPKMDTLHQPGTLSLAFRLPGLKERIFQWTLPIPPMEHQE